MTHTTTGPESVAAAGDANPEFESGIRQRLGNWTSPSAPTLVTSPIAFPGTADATMPLGGASAPNLDTVELVSAQPHAASEMMTMDLQQAVPVNAVSPHQAAHTQPFEAMNPAIRARLDAQAA